ncbi:MAG: M16 family metallopeptidase [Maricaulaceae bacterium]
MIPFETFTLENGLDVIFHIDRSDPVVAINLAAHVGSARERPGRTGFAHLFEHLLFLDSENLGYGGLDAMNTRIGGEGTNGFTTQDMTQYFQAVPKDALEKVVWAEADKLGFFIKTVTQPVLDNERQVVKNEKRQRVDNQPFGHNFEVISRAMYPADHPYSWQVIGSLADLDAATLDDVKAFYRRWYVPNNVTMTLSGDFDPAQGRDLIERYFGEIPRGDPIEPLKPRPARLETTVSLYHEDSFATVPRLTLAWPAVEQTHPDAAALAILSEYLTDGKRAPLNEILIDEMQLTSSASTFFAEAELAGEFYLIVDAKAGQDLNAVKSGVERAFERFMDNGLSQADLDRIKAGLEVDLYNQIQSALGKAIQLGESNTLANDPGFLDTTVARLQAVTSEDVMRVFETYLYEQAHIATSFVPKGERDLILEGAEPADVLEETFAGGSGAPVDFDPTARTFEPTPSSFDRSVEPDFGAPYTLPQPEVWRTQLGNGVEVYGVDSRETPLVRFSLRIAAGRDRGFPAAPAIPALTADILQKGVASKTTAELEDAIKALGSTISLSVGPFDMEVRGAALERNFAKTIALVEEILLEPRWDEDEFALLIQRRSDEIDQQAANPTAIALREVAELAYGADHVLGYQTYGRKDALAAVSIDDLKAFYQAYVRPTGASLRIAGAVDADTVQAAFQGLSERWTNESAPAEPLAPARAVTDSAVFIYDVPGAKQSVILAERPSLSAKHPDYPLAEAMNFFLGGIYTSQLNTELRVNRGYTYGVQSFFDTFADRGRFRVFTSVRSDVTLESLKLIRDILADYGPGFTTSDLETLKTALLRGQALNNETLSAKLGYLEAIADYGYPADFQARNAEAIEAMTLDDFKRLAQAYLRPEAMRWIVVGDAESQAKRLTELGFGEPVLLAAD